MGVQAWMIKSWPVIEWYLPPQADNWPEFWHLSTHVREEVRGGGLRCGDTVWIGVVDGKSVGAAWEWVELRPGVVMLMDPNSILSNIRFLDPDQTYQEHLAGLVSLNLLPHRLAWQPAVNAVLTALRDHPELDVAIPDLAAMPRLSEHGLGHSLRAA